MYNHTKICQADLVTLPYMVFLIIWFVLPQTCKRRNKMEILKTLFLVTKKRRSGKTLEMPLETLNTVKQHSRCLGTKRWSPEVFWNWHAPSCFSKAHPLMVTANFCHFFRGNQQKISGHVYGATPWPTRGQSFSGADTGAVSGAHTGHVGKTRGHRPKI